MAACERGAERASRQGEADEEHHDYGAGAPVQPGRRTARTVAGAVGGAIPGGDACRRRVALQAAGNWFDFLAVDVNLTTWRIVAVKPAERRRVLLGMMIDKRLARQVANGDRVQLHCWSQRSGRWLVEVVELCREDFL
jgi:hypothetical protein